VAQVEKKDNKEQIPIPECWHVGIVVKDVKKVVEFYSRAFGWGPWRMVETEFKNAEFRGKPTWYGGPRAFVRLGKVSLEIGETNRGESVHTEMMRNRGEGLHHLAFYVDDLEDEIAKIKGMGIPMLQTAYDKEGKHAYAYLNTEEWGNIIVELNARPKADFWATAMPNDIKVKQTKDQIPAREAWHVGIVVKDLKKTVDFYTRAFGWGPWRMVHTEFRNAEFRGKPTWYAGPRAFVNLGSVSLEIGETNQGESVHTEMLRNKGEGLHHLAFYVDDVEAEIAKMKNFGIPMLQTAWDKDGKHAYAYLNTEAWGNIIVELNWKPKEEPRK
jgi:methylmalonyl-CoA/ethylmalonyl-CoA epimerase